VSTRLLVLVYRMSFRLLRAVLSGTKVLPTFWVAVSILALRSCSVATLNSVSLGL